MPSSEGLLILLGTAVILLFLSAVFSGSEASFFSLDEDHISRLEAMHNRRSESVLSLISSQETLLASIMIWSTVLYLILILTLSAILDHFPVFSPITAGGLLLQLATISSVILVFGNVLPRLAAHNNPLGFAMFSSGILKAGVSMASPFSFMLAGSSSMINRRLLRNSGSLSIDDLSDAIDQNRNVVSEDRKILMGLADFSNKEVSDIMMPRMDVVSVDSETGFAGLIALINESGYSRIPVFSENLDNIKGILYVKDLLPFLTEKTDFRWQDLIRPGYFVPETKKIKDLLQEFLEKKIHMAVVVDEYGGTEGIVTLEDVLEEIVGEITDETDEIESYYSRIDDNNFIFDAKILLNDFFKIVKVTEESFEPERGDADTLAGLILEIKGEIPSVNDVIVLRSFTFTILSVDERRIRKVKFTIERTFKNR
jgi:putative hemolysin